MAYSLADNQSSKNIEKNKSDHFYYNIGKKAKNGYFNNLSSKSSYFSIYKVSFQAV